MNDRFLNESGGADLELLIIIAFSYLMSFIIAFFLPSSVPMYLKIFGGIALPTFLLTMLLIFAIISENRFERKATEAFKAALAALQPQIECIMKNTNEEDSSLQIVASPKFVFFLDGFAKYFAKKHKIRDYSQGYVTHQLYMKLFPTVSWKIWCILDSDDVDPENTWVADGYKAAELFDLKNEYLVADYVERCSQ
jgi:hypothetical protein